MKRPKIIPPTTTCISGRVAIHELVNSLAAIVHVARRGELEYVVKKLGLIHKTVLSLLDDPKGKKLDEVGKVCRLTFVDRERVQAYIDSADKRFPGSDVSVCVENDFHDGEQFVLVKVNSPEVMTVEEHVRRYHAMLDDTAEASSDHGTRIMIDISTKQPDESP